MEEYVVPYRVHGPANLSEEGKIGRGILRPASREKHNVVATITYQFEAKSQDRAEELALGPVREEAQTAINLLSFISEKGLLLGSHYWVRKKEAKNHSLIDGGSPIDSLDMDVADHVEKNLNDTLTSKSKARRSLNWYNYGLSTVVPEDQIVAFWTGIEAFAESKEKDLSEEEKQAFEDAKDAALGVVDQDEFPTVHGRIGSALGTLTKKSIPESVSELLTNSIDVDHIPRLSENELESTINHIYTARNKIVHDGKKVEEIDFDGEDVGSAVSLSNHSRNILRELIISHLPEAFAGFIDDEVPDRYPYSPVVGEDWIKSVFESDSSLELSPEEIAKRTFALTRDLSEIRRMPLDNYCGQDNPLLKTEAGKYRLNPKFDFTRE